MEDTDRDRSRMLSPDHLTGKWMFVTLGLSPVSPASTVNVVGYMLKRSGADQLGLVVDVQLDA